MNRRNFLKLATSILASFGLRIELPKAELKAEPLGKLPPLRDFWPMSVDAIKSCDLCKYVWATNGDVTIESYDSGKTWSKVNANTT